MVKLETPKKKAEADAKKAEEDKEDKAAGAKPPLHEKFVIDPQVMGPDSFLIALCR